MKAAFLSWLSRNWRKNRDNPDYPQTWYYMPYRRKGTGIGCKKPYWLTYLLQWLCGVCGGHELSKTEWGYGGGDYADRWCRWCNKRIEVLKESVFFQFKDSARHLMKQVGKEITE